eukprot:2105832-Amphidinium_carterae.1
MAKIPVMSTSHAIAKGVSTRSYLRHTAAFTQDESPLLHSWCAGPRLLPRLKAKCKARKT